MEGRRHGQAVSCANWQHRISNKTPAWRGAKLAWSEPSHRSEREGTEQVSSALLTRARDSRFTRSRLIFTFVWSPVISCRCLEGITDFGPDLGKNVAQEVNISGS